MDSAHRKDSLKYTGTDTTDVDATKQDRPLLVAAGRNVPVFTKTESTQAPICPTGHILFKETVSIHTRKRSCLKNQRGGGPLG